jgi:hypothetical protein
LPQGQKANARASATAATHARDAKVFGNRTAAGLTLIFVKRRPTRRA